MIRKWLRDPHLSRRILAASVSLNVLALLAGSAVCVYVRRGAMRNAGQPRQYYDRRVSLFHYLGQPPAGKIVFAGDSLTDQCEWAELISPLAVNRGIDSDTTAGLLGRIESITALQPSKLFLLIGVNDLRAGVPEETIIKTYAQLLRTVRNQSPATQIFVQSVLPNRFASDAVVRSLNRRLSALSKAEQATYLDIFAVLSGAGGGLDPQFTNDGVHLTARGYDRWKAALVAAQAIPRQP